MYKLTEIFNDYEEYFELSNLVENSRFVKIHYADNKYYYVGKITENGDIKYVCYGVLGSYNDVPKEVLKYFNFVPISKFDLNGKGYFLIFQNAKTGEIIKREE